jgi:hypothetical protein
LSCVQTCTGNCNCIFILAQPLNFLLVPLVLLFILSGKDFILGFSIFMFILILAIAVFLILIPILIMINFFIVVSLIRVLFPIQ